MFYCHAWGSHFDGPVTSLALCRAHQRRVPFHGDKHITSIHDPPHKIEHVSQVVEYGADEEAEQKYGGIKRRRMFFQPCHERSGDKRADRLVQGEGDKEDRDDHTRYNISRIMKSRVDSGNADDEKDVCASQRSRHP